MQERGEGRFESHQTWFREARTRGFPFQVKSRIRRAPCAALRTKGQKATREDLTDMVPKISRLSSPWIPQSRAGTGILAFGDWTCSSETTSLGTHPPERTTNWRGG